MPIVIQELVITAIVEGEPQQPCRDGEPAPDDEELLEALIAETMRIERLKRER